jgi:alpha-galactosidase
MTTRSSSSSSSSSSSTTTTTTSTSSTTTSSSTSTSTSASSRMLRRRRQQALPLLLLLLGSWAATLARATLVLPSTPPRGFNSFDLQMYSGEWGWNETAYRETALAMVAQGLVAKGYDTIVLDGGWSLGALDEWGRSVPPTQRWPSAAGPNGTNLGLKPLAKWTHDLGLKLGVWRIRGAPTNAVAAKMPVKGTNSTIDQLVWNPQQCPAGEERWCNCTWDHSHVGLDPTHPDSAKYYDSLVELFSDWDLDLIK